MQAVVEEAYAAWRSAAAIARAFDADDPRRAASRTHLALCHAALRRRREGAPGLPPGAPGLGGGGSLGRAHGAPPARPQLGLSPDACRPNIPAGTTRIARAEFAKLLGAGRAAALAGSAHLARNPAAPLEEAQEQRAAGLSWRDASQVAIWRALAALREEAGDGAAALDARQRAESIERDPVTLRAGASRCRNSGRAGERSQASRGGGLSDSGGSSSSLTGGLRPCRASSHHSLTRRGRLSSPSGRNITVRIRIAP